MIGWETLTSQNPHPELGFVDAVFAAGETKAGKECLLSQANLNNFYYITGSQRVKERYNVLCGHVVHM